MGSTPWPGLHWNIPQLQKSVRDHMLPAVDGNCCRPTLRLALTVSQVAKTGGLNVPPGTCAIFVVADVCWQCFLAIFPVRKTVLKAHMSSSFSGNADIVSNFARGVLSRLRK